MCSFQAKTSSLGTVTQPMTCSPLEWRYCMSFCFLVLESSLSGSKPVPPSHLCNTLWSVWLLFLARRSFKPHCYFLWKFVIVIESLSHVWLFVTPWAAACQASLSFTISRSLLKLSCPSSQWCHHTISSSAVPYSLAFSLSRHQSLFQWVGSSHQVAQTIGASVLGWKFMARVNLTWKSRFLRRIIVWEF